MRNKPTFANNYIWKEFEEWADREGIGHCTEDWEKWWECWMIGYRCAELNPDKSN